VDDVPLLFFAEELGLSGSVRQEEERSDGDQNCERALYEEDPRPSVVTTKFDLSEAGSEETTKCTTEGSSTVEDLSLCQLLVSRMNSAITHSQPEHELVPLVEHAEVQDDTSEHAALTSSQQ